ncbi:hypothetical protein KSP40_PGU006117 [Platanthera guangdongensis]|uniref:Uncharacterized protein n=1 Tax=Platanthera guangdongensis TaxID=2320717 RepID=A0ABR2MKP2_9ASPA
MNPTMKPPPASAPVAGLLSGGGPVTNHCRPLPELKQRRSLFLGCSRSGVFLWHPDLPPPGKVILSANPISIRPAAHEKIWPNCQSAGTKFHEVEVSRSMSVMRKERDWPTRTTFDCQLWPQLRVIKSPRSSSPSRSPSRRTFKNRRFITTTDLLISREYSMNSSGTLERSQASLADSPLFPSMASKGSGNLQVDDKLVCTGFTTVSDEFHNVILMLEMAGLSFVLEHS